MGLAMLQEAGPAADAGKPYMLGGKGMLRTEVAGKMDCLVAGR